MKESDFQTYREALEMGLYLAVTAPDEEKKEEALSMAKLIASCMTPEEEEAAKLAVEQRLEEENQCTLAFRMDHAGRITFIKESN